jgi:hypothetical protein
MELVRKPPEGLVIPSTATVNRILVQHGLVLQGKRKRSRDCYLRWQRPGPMQLWQLDIVGGVMLVDLVTGVLREAKVVTGVDDHSRCRNSAGNCFGILHPPIEDFTKARTVHVVQFRRAASAHYSASIDT